MEKYHKYIFDSEKRKFVGKFEEMYQNESKEIFDSWHQEDGRSLKRNINQVMLANYNFNCIVDIGCGKGSFTHLLKKKNNRVVGIDISETALQVARARYPDIDFICCDLNKSRDVKNILLKNKRIDLIFSSEVLSYIEKWKNLLKTLSEHTEYLMTSLFIPGNPIGHVKSERELVAAVKKHFTIIEWISIKKSQCVIVFGRSKKCK